MKKKCPGIFLDPRHIGLHFQYVTKSEPRDKEVFDNFETQIQLLEKYVFSEHQDDLNLLQTIKGVAETCAVERRGNRSLYFVHILRHVGDLIDKKGSELIRIEDDKGSVTSQPHILCLDSENKVLTFSIIVEKIPLLENIVDIQSAIAAFIHISFVLNMSYPKSADLLADVLQRKFARFGSDLGTRTNKSAKSACKRLDEFYRRLGALI